MARCFGEAQPAEYLVDAWQTSEGLPQNSVLAITQTPEGYLWLGTFNGLVRFNGQRFDVFNTANLPGLGLGHIKSLHTDRRGRLWMSTPPEGLVSYENGAFRREDPGHPLGEVEAITETPDGSLLFLTHTAIVRLTGSQWDSIPLPGSDFSRAYPKTLARSPDGRIYFSHMERLYRLENGSPELLHTFALPIRALLAADDGSVVCGLIGGRLADLVPGEEPRYTEFPGVNWYHLFTCPDGDFWGTAHEGIYRRRGGEWLHLAAAHGLISQDVVAMHIDREGNKWFGTNGGGLHRLREKVVRIHSTRNGLAHNDVTSVIQDREGRIWSSGFRCGVSVLEDGFWKPFPLLSDAARRPDILSLFQTRDGAIWMGGAHHPHLRWTGTELERPPISTDVVKVLFEDGDGTLWLGTDDGIIFWKEGETGSFDLSNRGAPVRVHGIAQDSSGNIWAGASFGLHQLHPDGTTTVYSHEDGLGADEVQSLYADEEGTLWIGTVGGGLSRFKDGRLSNINSSRGLPADTIGQILDDDLGNLWLSTTRGIVRIAKRDLHEALDGGPLAGPTAIFGRAEGIPQPECAGGFQPSSMKARDGTLWFCTISGLVVIDPERVPHNKIPPGVVIDRVAMDDQLLDLNPAGPRLVVPPGTARLELHYAGLSFVAPNKVRFLYMLEGYDDNWLNAGTRRSAYYTKVPPGNYRFHVLAANNDGVWNQTGASLAISVQPHFWQTAWFQLLAGLGVAGLLCGAVWTRFNNLNQVHALRLRIARDLHDEAGSNLASIQLLTRQAGKDLDRKVPRELLSEIEQISMDTAESIRQLIWLINPSFETLDQMLQQIETLVSRLLPDIECQFHWRVANRDRVLPLKFRSHFFLSVKEMLHNVSKHAQAARVTIELSDHQGHYSLIVRDDGVGFDVETAHRGHGLNSIQHRVAELGGQLEIRGGYCQGTTIHLKVPVGT